MGKKTGFLKDMIELGRLPFLLGGFLLFLVGFLSAIESLEVFPLKAFLAGYSVLFFGQLSISYSNNYYDFEADKKSKKTLFSGGSALLGKKPGLRKACFLAAAFLTAVSLLLAGYFCLAGILPAYFFLLAIAGNFLAWAYSAPPLRFSYKGLGEVPTAISFGLIMPLLGSYSASAGISEKLFLLMPALTLYGIVFILGVELPDSESDKQAGKKTFVAARGRKMAYRIILASAAFATAYLAMLYITKSQLVFLLLAACSIIPLAAAILVKKNTAKQKIAERLSERSVSSLIVFLMAASASIAFTLF